MKVAIFSTKQYDKTFLLEANQQHNHELSFFEAHLDAKTALLTKGYEAVCCFVNDMINSEVLTKLKALGVKLIALRCAGFNNVDLTSAKHLGITVVRVPAYSPHAIAEHAVALVLALNRKIHRASTRVREGDFSLHGLMGFNLHKKTVAVIGTGMIGAIFAMNMQGFGCKVIAFDINENPKCVASGIQYVSLDELFKQADIISLHCPLNPETNHLINSEAIAKMKKGVMIINTSRGAVIDTSAIINGLKNHTIGYLGLDVYEEEGDLFFEDLSDQIIQDDVFARLLTFPNVLITGHQGFFTREALSNIAETTLANITAFATGRSNEMNQITL